MKKKIVVFFLVIIIAFQSLAISTTKKAEASMTALIGAGVATGAFTAFASYMVASGYHMQISDMLVYFTNTFYDKVEDHYIAKAGKVSELEKLTYTTLGFLSGNNPLDQTALQQEMNDIIRNNAPAAQLSHIPLPSEIDGSPYNANLNSYIEPNYIKFTDVNSKVSYKINNDMSITDFTFPLQVENNLIGWVQLLRTVPSSSITRNHQLQLNFVSISNEIFSYGTGTSASSPSSLTLRITKSDNDYLVNFYFNTSTTIQKTITVKLGNIFTPVNVSIIPESPAADPTKNIKAVAPNWYDLVSGIAKTPQGILDRMDQDAALQQSILDRLAALEYGQDVPVSAPIVDPISGEVLYNQDIPASTDSDRLWGIGNWLRKIYDAIKSIPTSISNLYNKFITFPEDIANKIGALWNDVIVPGINSFWDSTKMAVTEAKDGILALPGAIGAALDGFWDNTLNPFFTDIKDAVVSIPGKLDALWDSTMEIPMEEIDLSKLNFQGFTTKFPFSIPFDYVNLIKQFVRAPIAPDLTIHLDTSYFTINHTIDMQPIAKYIVFLRWFLLVMFIFGLMMLTQRMIKW